MPRLLRLPRLPDSPESSSLGSRPVSSSKSGSCDLSMTLAAIICLISQRSGDETRLKVRWQGAIPSCWGTSASGSVTGRSGLRASSSGWGSSEPLRVLVLVGFRSSPLAWSTSCRGGKGMVYLKTHSTHFIYGYMAVQQTEGNGLFNDALNTFYLRLYGSTTNGRKCFI